jgi:hypothetical protein
MVFEFIHLYRHFRKHFEIVFDGSSVEIEHEGRLAALNEGEGVIGGAGEDHTQQPTTWRWQFCC